MATAAPSMDGVAQLPVIVAPDATLLLEPALVVEHLARVRLRPAFVRLRPVLGPRLEHRHLLRPLLPRRFPLTVPVLELPASPARDLPMATAVLSMDGVAAPPAIAAPAAISLSEHAHE